MCRLLLLLTVKSSDSVKGDVTVMQPVQVTVPGVVVVEAGFGFCSKTVTVSQPVQVMVPGALKMKDVFLKRI